MKTIARMVMAVAALAALAGCGDPQYRAQEIPVGMTATRLDPATLKVTAQLPAGVSLMDPVWFTLEPAPGNEKTATLTAVAIIADPISGTAETYVVEPLKGGEYIVRVFSIPPGIVTSGPVFAGAININTMYGAPVTH